jgi:hypothetical protein
MKNTALIPIEHIEQRIFLIRGKKVMCDFHLSQLYGVPTKALNLAVKRNADRFPPDFMFQLTKDEFQQVALSLRFQFGTSKVSGRGGRRYLPYAFTEHGALMLASVLNSPKAIEASIYVVRAFVRMRNILTAHKEIAEKLRELEQKISSHDADIQTIINVLKELMATPEQPKKRIGFRVEEPHATYPARRKKN